MEASYNLRRVNLRWKARIEPIVRLRDGTGSDEGVFTVTRVRTPRRIIGVAAVAILAAGCGGAAKSSLQGGNELAGAAGTKGLGADVMPASTLAFGDANIDASSEGWKRALALGARFPGFGKLMLDFNTSLNKRTGSGPTAAEVRSALGGEIAVGVTALKSSTSGSRAATLLVYAEVRDVAKLKGMLAGDKEMTALPDRGGFSEFSQKANGGTPGFFAISASAVLVSNDRSVLESAIDRSAGGADRLADSPEFKDAMKTLPDENILVGYVSPTALQQLGQAAKAQQGAAGSALSTKQMDQALASYQAVKGVAYSLDATTGGFRLRSSVRLDEAKLATLGGLAKQYQSFEPTLLARVPSTAYFAASFQNLGPMLKTAYGAILEQPTVKTQVAQFETLLGVKLDDLVALTSGEHAIYVGPGLPASGGLLLKPADAAKGAATLRALTKLLATRGIVVHDTGDGQDATLGTLSGRWRSVDGVVAIGTDATVGDKVKDPLFESAAVKQLFSDAGLDPTAKTAGAFYLDVPKLLDVATSLQALSSSPATDQQSIDNLRHLGGIVAWTARDGDLAVSDVFIGIK